MTTSALSFNYIMHNTTTIKRSFAPIENNDVIVLILGTMPGEKSLEYQQYYAHPQNRFWRVIAEITNQPLPEKYEDKTTMLLTSGIALWDVVHSAEREGSMDSNIKNEKPNDLKKFIDTHPNLKVVVFNGRGAEKLYSKYFIRRPEIHYISLPSTSPANARFKITDLCEKWGMALCGNFVSLKK